MLFKSRSTPIGIAPLLAGPLMALAFLSAGCSLSGDSESGAKSGVSNSPYLPLQPGSSWTYQSENVDSFGNRWRDTLRVFGTARIDGEEYALFWTESSPFYLRADKRGRILRYSGGKEHVWLDITQKDGAVYEYPYMIGSSERVYTVTVKHLATLQTPARTFQNCIRFTFDDHGARDDEVFYTVAPDVGIVERWTSWFGTFRLSDFQLTTR